MTKNSLYPIVLILTFFLIITLVLSTLSLPTQQTSTDPIILSEDAKFIKVKHGSDIQTITPDTPDFTYYQHKTDKILQTLNRKLFFQYTTSIAENTMQRSDYILVRYAKPIETNINNYGIVTFTEAIFLWDSEGLEPKYILTRKTKDFTVYDSLGFTNSQYSIDAFQIQAGHN